MAGQIVEVSIRPPQLGGGGPKAGVQETVKPKIYGSLYAEGCSKDVAYIVLHPAINWFDHYLAAPLQARGQAVLTLNSRYVGNDSMLLVERVLQDVGAGVKFLRERGYRRIFYIGNSGGGSIGTAYQAQAEKCTITHTPDGLPIDVFAEDLPPLDGLVLASAHVGRARHLRNSLDPSVVNEADALTADPELDMFNRDNGPPYAAEWLARYEQKQGERYRKITDWVVNRLKELDQLPPERSMSDEAFIIHRTYAKPANLDPSIDPNDRPQGQSIWGNLRATNYAPSLLGRFTTLRSYLSQWSPMSLAGDGPARLAETSVPVFNIRFSADEGTYPRLTQEYSDAAKGRCDDYVLKGAQHFPFKQKNGDAIVSELADVIADWGRRR